MPEHELQRFFARCGGHQDLPEILENCLVDKQVGRTVVDKQNVFGSYGH